MRRILFVGDDWYGSNATSLRDALQHEASREGIRVESLNTYPISNPKQITYRIAKRFGRAAYDARARAAVLSQARAARDQFRPDAVIVFKGNYVSAEALNALGAVSAHFHPDDAMNPENVSPTYLAAEAYYSMHFTTKSFNVAEITARCGRPTRFVHCAYDDRWHRPLQPQREFFCGFTGTRRPDRESLIAAIARAFGSDMLLAGTGWSRLSSSLGAAVVEEAQFGLSYSQTVADAPVQLGFLNSANRDLHTCRSFEVPAAGGLLLAEDTPEHRELFEDGKEAVLHSSSEMLFAQLEWLRQDGASRSSIRENGHLRVTRGGNTYRDRARTILQHIRTL